jgi:hypothetical protein
MGRPPKGKKARTEVLQIRLTPDELKDLKRRAARSPGKMTDYIRKSLGLEE